MTGNVNPRDAWYHISCEYPGAEDQSNSFKFLGRGHRDTPVMGARGLVTIMKFNLLQGEEAAKRLLLVRYLGEDLSLIQEVPGMNKAQQQLPHDPRMVMVMVRAVDSF